MRNTENLKVNGEMASRCLNCLWYGSCEKQIQLTNKLHISDSKNSSNVSEDITEELNHIKHCKKFYDVSSDNTYEITDIQIESRITGDKKEYTSAWNEYMEGWN